MANQYCNHIVANGEVLVDLRADTVTAADVASGKTFHDAAGEPKVGTARVPGDVFGDLEDKTPSSNSKSITFNFTRPAEGYRIVSATIVLVSTFTASNTNRNVICVTRPKSAFENAYSVYVHETAKSNYHVAYASQATASLTWSGSETGNAAWTVTANMSGFSENVYFRSGSTYRCHVIWEKVS